MIRRPRVIVGLSGGVDSSVAALLLVQQGYEVHAVFMKNWEDAYEPGYCAANDDLLDAEDVCDTLGIALHKVNFSAEYRERVFAHFLDEYRNGRTPNPDILCNSEIKFDAFLDHARRLGADHIATGHYARLQRGGDGDLRLLKGSDPNKDQSYFLHALQPWQLADAVFPLGGLHKREVRKIAAAAGLATADKKDSTGICFIGERDFRQFLGHYLSDAPGPMQTPEGAVVGEHRGLAFYTLGQRQGLAIGGPGGPWYVAAKDRTANALIVVQGDHRLLYSRKLLASKLNWIAGQAPRVPYACCAKNRYRQADQACTIVAMDEERCEVVFEQPQRSVTPGQSVVFYQGDECLGGGVIDAAYG